MGGASVGGEGWSGGGGLFASGFLTFRCDVRV